MDPASADANFNFLVSSDSQFQTKEEAQQLKEECKQIAGTSGSPAFFANVGDLTLHGYDQQLEWYLDAVSEFSIPVYNIFGGHDGNYALPKKSVDNFEARPWYVNNSNNRSNANDRNNFNNNGHFLRIAYIFVEIS